MAPSDEPEVIVVRVTDGRAIVIGAPSETEPSPWGRWISNFTHHELASLVRTLDPVSRALIEARRLTGCLVELDPTSRAMWSSLKKVTEDGGWIQANFRNDRGQFARLMRIRPATGVAAVSGGAAILGAIAAQAQTAEMARDVKAIRQRVDEIYEHLQGDQIGAVQNAVEQVEDLVARLRVHGPDGIRESEVPLIKDRLGDARHKCMIHLKDAVKKLEDAKQHGSLRRAETSLRKGAVKDVMLYLNLLGKLYPAWVQFGLAQVALDYHEGKSHVARTQTEHIVTSTSKFRAEVEDVCVRLGQLDESIRTRFGSVSKHGIWLIPLSRSTAKTAYAFVGEVAGTKVITVRLPGASIPIPVKTVAAVGGALLPSIVGAGDATVRRLAEKKLDERLLQLTGARCKIAESMNQAAASLEVLHTLAEEFSVSGE